MGWVAFLKLFLRTTEIHVLNFQSEDEISYIQNV